MSNKVAVTRNAEGISVVTARCDVGEGQIYVRPNGTMLLGGDFAAPLPTAMIGLLCSALRRAQKIAPQQPAIPDGAKFTARIATGDTIDPDFDLRQGCDIVITVDGCPGPPIAIYNCHTNPFDLIGEDPDEVLQRNGWRPYGIDQLDFFLYRVTSVERIQPPHTPTPPSTKGTAAVSDRDTEDWPETYARVLTKLDEDPDAPLGELEARAIPQRWLTELDFPLWGSAPYPNLAEWATGGSPEAVLIRAEDLIEEAERMRTEILAPAQRTAWSSWDEGGTPEVAAAALNALIRYLARTPTPQTVADWVFANTDLHDYPTNTRITEKEARLIAVGWAEDRSTLQHWGANLIDTEDARSDVLLSQARQVRDSQQLNTENWPHAGEPEPVLMAMAALIRYLERVH
jgi:hypothetical protein